VGPGDLAILAGIAAGLLAADGTVPLGGAIVATGLGIWAGDLGLWAVGRWLKRPTLANQFLTRHSGAAIVTSRFLPGTRLAVYVAAGASGVPLVDSRWAAVALFVGRFSWADRAVRRSRHIRFAPTLARAGICWLSSGRSGAAVDRFGARHFLRAGALGVLAGGCSTHQCPWVLYLLLTAARSAHRGEPASRTEDSRASQSRILACRPWTAAHRLDSGSAPGGGGTRAPLARMGQTFPLILKPDVGQRGDGVRLVHGEREALEYLAAHNAAVIAQVYHPGPYEAGIFYYRLPGEARGRIFSLTDKHFPHVVGDGRTTLAALIQRHPRYHLQSPLFFGRHQADLARILRPGEPFRLGVAGNLRGAIFLDGSDLITEATRASADRETGGRLLWPVRRALSRSQALPWRLPAVGAERRDVGGASTIRRVRSGPLTARSANNGGWSSISAGPPPQRQAPGSGGSATVTTHLLGQ
jgi:hypothetical protein